MLFSMSARSWSRRSRKPPKRLPVSGSRPPNAPFNPSISPLRAPRPSADASACVNFPSWNPCWMSPSWPRSAASRRSCSRRPVSACSSALARGESSIPCSSRNFWRSSIMRWNASASSSRASCVFCVISSITWLMPEKNRSKTRSNTSTSTARLTAVVRSVARTVSRSPRPTMPRARMASMVSETEMRRPFCRSSAQNATILSSIVASRSVLVEDVLLVPGRVRRGGAGRLLLLGALQLPEVLELLLRLADVGLVLEDDRQRVVDELVVERVHVQEKQRPCPVERLADAGMLLQVELPDALDERHDVAGELLTHAGDLELHDRQLV